MLIDPRAVLCCAATLVALSLVASNAHAYQCKPGFTQVEAVGNPTFKARKSARNIWASTVKDNYGLQWASWDIAAAKSVDCSWTGNQFYCIAKAKPCLYVAP